MNRTTLFLSSLLLVGSSAVFNMAHAEVPVYNAYNVESSSNVERHSSERNRSRASSDQDNNDPAQTEALADNDGYQSADAAPSANNNSNLSLQQRVTKLENQLNNLNQMNLLAQIQSLQQEIQTLHGQLDVQAHDLARMEESQKAMYADLNQRLNAKGTAVATAEAAPAPAVQATATTDSVSPTTTAANGDVEANASRFLSDQDSYEAAYQLIKNKNYPAAIPKMQQYLKDNPTGQYAANAHYWLGELYSMKKDNTSAITHFQAVVDSFPQNPKVADSKLKLALIYISSGQAAKSKELLQSIVKDFPNTADASLAKARLATLSGAK